MELRVVKAGVRNGIIRGIGAGNGYGPLKWFKELLKATLLLTSTRATRLFCDVYNPQSKTYCKRLQVLCPEHSRDPKVRFSFNYLRPALLCLMSHSRLFFLPLFLLFFPVNHLQFLPFASFALSKFPIPPHLCPWCPCRCQLMRSVGVHLYVMSLSSRVTSAACPSASAIAIIAGRSFGVQKWTWSVFGW